MNNFITKTISQVKYWMSFNLHCTDNSSKLGHFACYLLGRLRNLDMVPGGKSLKTAESIKCWLPTYWIVD